VKLNITSNQYWSHMVTGFMV